MGEERDCRCTVRGLRVEEEKEEKWKEGERMERGRIGVSEENIG